MKFGTGQSTLNVIRPIVFNFVGSVWSPY